MNLLVTINQKYLPYFATMITSLAQHNPGEHQVYIIANDFTTADLIPLQQQGKLPTTCHYHVLPFETKMLGNRVTTYRWPITIYFKLFAHKILPPTLDRILFLDADLIIKDNISDLYNLDFDGNLFIGATHIHSKLGQFWLHRLIGAKQKHIYINCGVMLMNLALMRKSIDPDVVLNFIKHKRGPLFCPEQDIICVLFGDRIKLVDPLLYNFTERYFSNHGRRALKQKITPDWVATHTKIIHYLGKHKPWLPSYKGCLKHYWDTYDVTLK